MSNFHIIDPHERNQKPATFTPHPLRPLPGAGVAFDIRPGTVDDIPWIDALQKENKRGLGFMRFGELEGHLKKDNVYVAVATDVRSVMSDVRCPTDESDASRDADITDQHSDLKHADPRIGYCIAADRYYQRDEVGQVYQMCVARNFQRLHIGSNLLAKVWDTWPRGVKLCGCWCAQDLEANRYWEGCGFTPVAFRAGSRQKSKKGDASASGGRIHIYWQKRIRSGDTETAYWYPKQTQGGAMNEARIVFPIPPGSSWWDAKPAVYPGVDELFQMIAAEREAKEKQMLLQLAPPQGSVPKLNKQQREAAKAERDAKRAQAAERSSTAAGHGGLRIGWNAAPIESVPSEEDIKAAAKASKQKLREAKQQARQAAKKAAKAMHSVNDPALVAAARELSDRWMEAVAADPGLLALSGDAAYGGYDVARQLEACSVVAPKRVENLKRLAA
ncbi:MAG: hypothetical protein AAF663_01050 [Planctomycetota bacterium]